MYHPGDGLLTSDAGGAYIAFLAMCTVEGDTTVPIPNTGFVTQGSPFNPAAFSRADGTVPTRRDGRVGHRRINSQNGLAFATLFGWGTGKFDAGARSLLDVVTSKSGVPIRLTDERWVHISEEHCELAGLRHEVLETVANPARIYAGRAGELLAVRKVEADKWLVVVYRELGDDGFVITAFLTRRITSLERRRHLWP